MPMHFDVQCVRVCWVWKTYTSVYANTYDHICLWIRKKHTHTHNSTKNVLLIPSNTMHLTIDSNMRYKIEKKRMWDSVWQFFFVQSIDNFEQRLRNNQRSTRSENTTIPSSNGAQMQRELGPRTCTHRFAYPYSYICF